MSNNWQNKDALLGNVSVKNFKKNCPLLAAFENVGAQQCRKKEFERINLYRNAI
jgi:hypothetical protein